MCDTFVATSEATHDGVAIFAKNSDREPNEAQYLEFVPTQNHPAKSQIQTTYIQIPQVEHTHAVLLSKPFWIWGAEMGVNEFGVAIGNEAVFTKEPYVKEKTLIGMDLLRLGLERGKSAKEALEVILALLKEYGQGGNCGYQHSLYYHNSFLIADPQESWVLETAGDHWAAKKVKNVYSISNCISLKNEFDMRSPDLISHAVQKGWCRNEHDFDFGNSYSDFIYTKFSDGRKRRQRTMSLLNSQIGEMSVKIAAQILRDHGEDSGDNWNPDKGLIGADVCMHASFGPVRVSQTAGSMIVHLHPEHPTCFVTGTAAPCTSVFKPVWLDIGLPNLGTEPKGIFDNNSLFWRHEALHRAILQDYATRIQIIKPKIEELEDGFIQSALELADQSAEERSKFSEIFFKEADEAETEWLKSIKQSPIQNRRGFFHSLAWKNFNRKADIEI
jgi:secernin